MHRRHCAYTKERMHRNLLVFIFLFFNYSSSASFNSWKSDCVGLSSNTLLPTCNQHEWECGGKAGGGERGSFFCFCFSVFTWRETLDCCSVGAPYTADAGVAPSAHSNMYNYGHPIIWKCFFPPFFRGRLFVLEQKSRRNRTKVWNREKIDSHSSSCSLLAAVSPRADYFNSFTNNNISWLHLLGNAHTI